MTNKPRKSVKSTDSLLSVTVAKYLAMYLDISATCALYPDTCAKCKNIPLYTTPIRWIHHGYLAQFSKFIAPYQSSITVWILSNQNNWTFPWCLALSVHWWLLHGRSEPYILIYLGPIFQSAFDFSTVCWRISSPVVECFYIQNWPGSFKNSSYIYQLLCAQLPTTRVRPFFHVFCVLLKAVVQVLITELIEV